MLSTIVYYEKIVEKYYLCLIQNVYDDFYHLIYRVLLS